MDYNATKLVYIPCISTTGQMNHASNLYKQVLVCPCEVNDPSSDLRKEAAFNLSLIYKASGNTTLARHILSTYCVV